MNSDPQLPDGGLNSDVLKFAGQAGPRDVPPPPPIPDHEMLRCIGQGSYGWVWLARNLMGVFRAVKIVYRNKFESSRPFERELHGVRKFEPISRSHAGFVDVLHIGQNEQAGCFYYVMEVADDEVRGTEIEPASYAPLTLSKRLARNGRLPISDCVKLGLDLSQALSELHRNGLVHRDVKPANIVFCDKVPKLADIGLVTESDQAFSISGTEGFIPPEGPGSVQADIYSLGKVLYEAATGKDRLDFPEMPDGFDKMPDATSYLELNEVILKACETKTESRYCNAWDMHADLVVLANGKSVQRLRALERGFARLKRASAIAAVVLVCAGIVGFEVYRGKQTAQKNRERLVGEKVANWDAAMESGDMLGGLLSSADAFVADKDDPANARAHWQRFNSALALCPKLIYLRSNTEKSNDPDAIFWPDGTKVLLSRNGKPLQTHDLASGTVDESWGTNRILSKYVSFSRDGKRMATGEVGQKAHVWDVMMRTKLCTFRFTNNIASAELSLDGQHLAVACGRFVWVFNVDSKETEFPPIQSRDLVQHASFSHNGKLIATAGNDRTVRLYQAENGEPWCPQIDWPDWSRHVAFSPDDRKLVVACNDHTARVYDITANLPRLELPVMRHQDGVNSVEFSPDGRLIVTASYDGTVRLWTAADHLPLWPNPRLPLGERAYCARFDAEGSRIVAVTVKGSIFVFDLAGCVRPRLLSSQRFSGDRSRFVQVEGSDLRVMNTASGDMISRIQPAMPWAEARLDDSGKRLMVLLEGSSTNANSPGTQVYDVAMGVAIGTPLPLNLSLTNLVMSPDGIQLAAIEGQKAIIWNVKNCSKVSEPAPLKNEIQRVVWSSDGSRIALLSSNEGCIYDPVGGTNCFAPLTTSGKPFLFSDLQFSPDCSRFVICEKEPNFEECSATLRYTATGEVIGDPMGHSDGVLRCVFSPDGRWIGTGGEDFMAHVWSGRDASHVSGPMSHGHQVWGIAFSSDSRLLATASRDKTARVWIGDTGKPLIPPLRFRFELGDVKFIDHDRKIVVTGRPPNTQTWIWDLSMEMGSAEELEVLAHLLNGTVYRTAGKSGPLLDGPLDSVWNQLKKATPKRFTTTIEDLVAWHRFEADLASDAKRDGFDQHWALHFHTNRLAKLEGGSAKNAQPASQQQQ